MNSVTFINIVSYSIGIFIGKAVMDVYYILYFTTYIILYCNLNIVHFTGLHLLNEIIQVETRWL